MSDEDEEAGTDGPILQLPRLRRAKAYIWKDIGVSETDKLLRLTDSDDIKNLIQDSLQIAVDLNGRHLIIIDLFYYAVRFCQRKSFNSEKTSCFLSIIKQTHELASETPFGNLGETMKLFKDLVICHSVHRPPFSLGIFSPQEAAALSTYFIDTYFRHFKLYKYAFTPQVQLDLSIDYLKIPKTPQEIDEEKKIVADDLATSARSDVEGNAEQDKSQGEDVEADAAADPRTESLRELKRIVRERLTAEMQELRTSFGGQLKQSDEALGKLVTPPQQQQQQAETDGKKSGRLSGKKKK